MREDCILTLESLIDHPANYHMIDACLIVDVIIIICMTSGCHAMLQKSACSSIPNSRDVSTEYINLYFPASGFCVSFQVRAALVRKLVGVSK